MAQDNAERVPIGRTALGGAACGFTYDGALLDAVARERGLRRPLGTDRWQAVPRPAKRAEGRTVEVRREVAEATGCNSTA